MAAKKCHKIKHVSQSAAWLHARALEKKSNGFSQMRTYYCKDCTSWHTGHWYASKKRKRVSR